MKSILDQMEEHIAAIRNLQLRFEYHSKRLEKLMKALDDYQNGINNPETTEFLRIEEKS